MADPRGLATLPPIRGRVQQAAPLAPFTWFRVGGPAEWLVRPADMDDLLLLLRDLPDQVPLAVIGAASNLIIRDGGVRGVVLRLAGKGFGDIVLEDDGIIAGAAALDAVVAEHAAAAGLAGLEFLSGIPGAVGGAVAMNAGAYGAEVKDVLDWAEVATPRGLLRLTAAEFGFAYRKAVLPTRGVVARARFRARPGQPAAIAVRMAEIRAAREATQPVRARTGGSTFKNPPGEKAWALVDVAGCRGLVRGGAQVSEKHTNFLLNLGSATAADIEGLGEEVRARVLASSGITLEWEIQRIGEVMP
ncbi:UDP-N-acetylmuramate dehydrogenase [Falsiroseomonas stagni]|uniref:UDP-N-acetylenolpyruvoylglucosamine reductase n=1 Tax=Falsiroseomonas stagni DSM 19981 TaxID=1123062 RepID=A0A1I3ZHM9_9PROT|nr:UDP-N-acetylmuramate dehydrogenase [Falsiroseomonas stagni]SFK43181.1 UDP-N-acetylmuramate dehydrogenase [Falsiroseomonas stagni DSM 19981]